MPNELLTMTQAAERMNCSRQWVHYLISEKRLKAQLVGGRLYMIKVSDLKKCEVRERIKPRPAKVGRASKRVVEKTKARKVR